MLYEPKNRQKPVVTPCEAAAICILGVPALWIAIKVFFLSMVVFERIGQFVCRHLFSI